MIWFSVDASNENLRVLQKSLNKCGINHISALYNILLPHMAHNLYISLCYND